MEISTKLLEVHPEDRDLVGRLAVLQDMHDQVLDLRTLLPQRLWNPMLATIKTPAGSQPPYSPSALYAHLTRTADDGCREVARFKAAWHSTDMQELWRKTNAEVVPQGTDTWQQDNQAAIRALKQKEGDLLSAAARPATVEEDPKAVVDSFKTKYPALKLEPSEEAAIWPLTLTVAGMVFEIDEQVVDDAKVYHIGPTVGKRLSNLQLGIVKLVEQRKKQDSLACLLDMLASYDGIRTRMCDKCQKIIDDHLEFAMVRESKTNPVSGHGDAVQWLAYHRNCA